MDVELWSSGSDGVSFTSRLGQGFVYDPTFMGLLSKLAGFDVIEDWVVLGSVLI